MIQLSMFGGTQKFVNDKPIRLTTLFSGYDSQALALKYLGIEFEHYHTCEWEVNAIKALKELHFANDNTDYSKDLTKSELIEYLANIGISNDGKEPMKKESIARKNELWLRETYNNIKATKNLVNIMNVKGGDVVDKESESYTNIWFYSFPCQ